MRGKDDLVLCPSAWLDPFHTEDFGSVINCALRYAMHAEDKESEAVIRYLRHRCGILDEKTLSVAVADLDRELKQPSPSLKNPQVWQELQGMFRQAAGRAAGGFFGGCDRAGLACKER